MGKRERVIKAGIGGAGYMGSGLLAVLRRIPEIEVKGIYDEDIKQAREAKESYGGADTKVYADPEELCADPEIEAIVDTNTSPLLGAMIGYYCAQHGKHLVSLNIECDATIGCILTRIFQKKGLIYTVTEGDEPGELKKMYDHYAFLNFKVLALGKGKNNPLQVEANPDTVKVPGNGITARQVASFVDGSKTMVEMASVSNGIGFPPDTRGMHGVEARIKDLPRIFSLKEEGGILNREGVVEYILGKELAGGVFIVVKVEDERIVSDLNYLKIGEGNTYCFYQRYHNWFIDTPLTVARVVREGKAVIFSLPLPTSEVVAVAKKDLEKGEIIDGIGGFSVYGVIEKRDIAKRDNLLPLGITEGAEVKRSIKKGEVLTWENVILKEDSLLFQLRKEQDSLG